MVDDRHWCLLRLQLTQCTGPIFHVIGLRDFSVFQGVDVYRHDLEAFAFTVNTKQWAAWCAARAASNDNSVVCNQHFFNFPVHVRDKLCKATQLADKLVGSFDLA